jgi:hypothetical protein
MFATILEASIKGWLRSASNAFNDFKDLNDLNSSDFRRLSSVFIIPIFQTLASVLRHPWLGVALRLSKGRRRLMSDFCPLTSDFCLSFDLICQTLLLY